MMKCHIIPLRQVLGGPDSEAHELEYLGPICEHSSVSSQRLVDMSHYRHNGRKKLSTAWPQHVSGTDDPA